MSSWTLKQLSTCIIYVEISSFTLGKEAARVSELLTDPRRSKWSRLAYISEWCRTPKLAPVSEWFVGTNSSKVCKAFDVMKLKSMYGREYMGVDRSTFIVDTKGKIVKEWRGVKVKGHVAEVLGAVEELTN